MTGEQAGTPTPHEDVNEVVAQLLTDIRSALGDDFAGMYLGGSLATGAFDPETSDVDLVVVTRGDVTDDLGAALRAAHDRITAFPSQWAKRLEILYVPLDTLKTRHESTQRCAYLGVGGWFGVVPYQSDWILQLHLVREHGIVLAGPYPKELIGPISSGELRASCAAIMRDWEPLLHDKSRFDAEYQAYTVLTMCRMLHTLEHSAIASKSTAAEWAAQKYGVSWGVLIDRALNWRHGMPFDELERVLELLAFTLERSRVDRPSLSKPP